MSDNQGSGVDVSNGISGLSYRLGSGEAKFWRALVALFYWQAAAELDSGAAFSENPATRRTLPTIHPPAAAKPGIIANPLSRSSWRQNVGKVTQLVPPLSSVHEVVVAVVVRMVR